MEPTWAIPSARRRSASLDASASSQPLIARNVLPGGTCGSKPCWKVVAGGYRYRNKVVLGRRRDVAPVTGAGELVLLIRKGAALDVPSLDFLPPIRLQLLASDAGVTCWGVDVRAIKNSDALQGERVVAPSSIAVRADAKRRCVGLLGALVGRWRSRARSGRRRRPDSAGSPAPSNDLDDRLRPHVDDVPLAADLARKCSVCHRSMSWSCP
jgi:hypothetical protein